MIPLVYTEGLANITSDSSESNPVSMTILSIFNITVHHVTDHHHMDNGNYCTYLKEVPPLLTRKSVHISVAFLLYAKH